MPSQPKFSNQLAARSLSVMQISTRSYSILATLALFVFGLAPFLVAQGHTHAVTQDPCFGPCEDAVGISKGCGGGGGSSQNYGDQMILLHSGQERRRQVDMRIEGRDHAVPFVVERKHLTRVDQVDSIFGSAWAFNYDHTFTREVAGNDLVFVGFGRTDTFGATKFDAGGQPIQWKGKSGRLDFAIHDTAVSGKLKVRRPGGTTMIFEVVLLGGNIDSGYLIEVQSPNGNSIKIEYEAAIGTSWTKNNSQRPDHIVDSFGRTIDFVYGNTGTYPDLVASIVDMDTRTVVYDYTNDHLITVRSPVVSTGINDFLSGKTRMYHYRGTTDPTTVDPVLKYALESEVFPNEFVSSSIPVLNGPPRLRWTYDEVTVPSKGKFFGWVTEHFIGDDALAAGLKAGGKFTYSYEDKYTMPGINLENIRTTVTNRRGVVSILRFNALGQMLREDIVRDTASFRPAAQSSFSGDYVREFYYKEDGNDDGILVWSKTPQQFADKAMFPAAQTDISFSSATNIPRLAAASPTATVVTPDSRGFDSPDGTIGTSVIYEPVFNRPFKVTDERGFFTIYRYDYMEKLADSVPVLAPKIGLSTTELNNLLADLGITNQNEINFDGTTAQYCGNVIKIEHPVVSLPSQVTATIIGLGTTQTAVETFKYNAFGQEIYHKDAEGNAHEKTYNLSIDPDGDSTNDVSGVSGNGGYLKTVKIDTDSAAERNSGTLSEPSAAAVNKETVFEYDTQGTYLGNKRGIPTRIKDPRGIEKVFLVNQLDQVVVEKRAETVPSGLGLTNYGYWTETHRDANDNVVEVRVQDLLPGATGTTYVSRSWEYNILDLVELRTEEAGSVGLPIKTAYEYDESTNLIETINGYLSSVESKTTSEFDERNIPFTTTRGANVTADASTTTNKIDANGNITVEIDADGADETLFTYDGYDRVKMVTDRLGYTRELALDAAGNILTEEIKGKIDTLATGSNFLQSKTEYNYDNRNRTDRVDRHIFHYTGFSVGTIDDGDLIAGQAGKVTTVYIFDQLGRTTWVVDADKNYTETKWDGAGRKHQEINWQASPSAKEYNIRDLEYDKNDNLTKLTDTEKNVDNLVMPAEVFVWEYDYDSLNRKVLEVEPKTIAGTNLQETAYEYDSRNNMVRKVDELLNETEYSYDKLSRLEETRIYLAANGLDADSTIGNHDDTRGGNDGVIKIIRGYDELHRVNKRTDDKLNVTVIKYDVLSRKVEVDYADGTIEKWTYNDDSELLTHTTQNNSVETWSHDAKGRPTLVLVNNGGVALPNVVVGSTIRGWGYDALDRSWGNQDLNGPLTTDDVTVIKWRDSLGRVIQEKVQIGAGTPKLVKCEYQGANRLVKETYPSGMIITRTYDDMDRQKEVNDATSGTNLIAEFDYVGAHRVAKTTYGNGTYNTKISSATLQTTNGSKAGYDLRGRHIYHEWLDASNAQITCYTNEYNGTNGVGTNRRINEKRKHLSNHKDTYVFDSAYRMLEFKCNYATNSYRELDGADKMKVFFDGAALAPSPPAPPGTPAPRHINPLLDVSPGGLNQYTSLDAIGQTYDSNGALANIAATIPIDYEYDSQDRLVHIKLTLPGPPINTYVSSLYVYDADGRRVATCVPGPSWRWDFWRGNQVIEESNLVTGAKYREYVDGAGIDEHLRMTDHTPPVGGPKDYYYHCNSQGSTGAMTDSTGAPAETYEYGWFGLPTYGTQINLVTGNPYMFQGRRADADSGLYYFRNRYYDPKRDEFRTIDPSGMWRHGQGNGYSAFAGDPWNNTDPMGLYSSFEYSLSYLGIKDVSVNVLSPNSGAEPQGKGKAVRDLFKRIFGKGKGAKGRTPKSGKKAQRRAKEKKKRDKAKKCRKKNCKPCRPPLYSVAYRADGVGADGVPHKNFTKHFPHEGPHIHFYEMHQSPKAAGCKCFWKEIATVPYIQRVGLPTGVPVVVPAQGGGVR